MGKKKKKKAKLPEGTPIEKYEYFTKEKEALNKHAIKVAAELNAMRNQRTDLETDRDNMVQYYGNAVYQLVKVEREVRRAERHLIHVQEMGQDDLGEKVDIQPFLRLGEERIGYVGYAMDKYREVFKGEGDIARERQRIKKETWERALDGEVALLKVRHRARHREIGKIGEAYTEAILEANRERKENQDKLLDMMEETADEDFKRLVLVKNRQVHDMMKNHERDIQDLKEAYNELKYCDVTIRHRGEAVKLADELSHLANLLADTNDFTTKHRDIKESALIQANILKEMQNKEDSMEISLKERKDKFQELAECNYNLMLEVNLIQDYDEINEEQIKILWKDCFSEIKKTRIKQMKIYHVMDTLRQILQKELKENLELLNKHQGKVSTKLEQLWYIYKSRKAVKDTIGDLAERALLEVGLHAENLDLPLSYRLTQHQLARRVRPALPEETKETVPVGRVTQRKPVWDLSKFGIRIFPSSINKNSNRTVSVP